MMEKTQPGVDPALRGRTAHLGHGFIDESGMELAPEDYNSRNEVYKINIRIMQKVHIANLGRLV